MAWLAAVAMLPGLARADDAPASRTADRAFEGSDLFVGRTTVRPTSGVRFDFGVEAQVVPMRLALASSRDQIIDESIAAACKGSTTTNCTAQAQAAADQALAVIRTMPDARFAAVQASSAIPADLEAQLKAAGVTDPRQIQSVKDFLASVPAAKRSGTLSLARDLTQNDTGDVRIEPFARVEWKRLEMRLGVPMSIGASSGPVTGFALGNLTVDAKHGWTFPVRHATLGVSVGLGLFLPTATSDLGSTNDANLFTAPRYLKDRLTLAPFAAFGADMRWVSVQASAQLVLVNRVKGSSGDASAQYLQYGTGLVLLPRFPVALVGELDGMAGLHNAAAHNNLFAVAGLKLRLVRFHLDLAVQVPVWEAASIGVGSYNGVDVDRVAHLSVLARTSLAF